MLLIRCCMNRLLRILESRISQIRSRRRTIPYLGDHRRIPNTFQLSINNTFAMMALIEDSKSKFNTKEDHMSITCLYMPCSFVQISGNEGTRILAHLGVGIFFVRPTGEWRNPQEILRYLQRWVEEVCYSQPSYPFPPWRSNTFCLIAVSLLVCKTLLLLHL